MSDRLDIWIAILLIVSGFVLFQVLSTRRRRLTLSGVAQQLGLTFAEHDWGPRSSGPRLESEHFRKVPSEQTFFNSMSGKRAGLAVSFFDHHIASGRGGDHTDTIASFTQSVSLPDFALAQGDVLTKLVDSVMHRQITFPSDQVFSERFLLTGSDETRVRELFTAEMREFLISVEPQWRIEASGHTLVIYQNGYAVRPDELADFVDETTQMAKAFLAHCHLKEPAF